MIEMLEKISYLSEFSFKIGISNTAITITLKDEENEEVVELPDFLRMLENGSILHNIVATRPLEKTWLIMKEEIVNTYNDCIASIINDDIDKQKILTKLIFLKNRIKAMLQQNVPAELKDFVTCELYHKYAKIN